MSNPEPRPSLRLKPRVSCSDARVSGDIVTWNDDLAASWQRVYQLQPFGKRYTANRLTRWLVDWYFMRLLIYVTPRSIRWWPDGDEAQAPQVAEVAAGVE
jgi:hypothetical protein